MQDKVDKLKEIISNNPVALIFPGQASQYKSMGLQWYQYSKTYREMFDYISKKVREQFGADGAEFDLLQIIEDEQKLNITLYSQICIFSVSVACYYSIKEYLGGNVFCFAGHSLGEFSAMTCCNVLNLDDSINLVIKRGYFMHHYSRSGTMFAVIYSFNKESITYLENYLKDYDSVIANYNSYNQLIVSCPNEVAEQLKENIRKEFNGCRIIPLKVSGAFHSYLVNPANDKFVKEIEKIEFKKPDSLLFLNSQVVSEPSEIKKTISNQMVTPVNWIKTVENIINYNPDIIFLEILPNKVLTNLIKKGFKQNINAFSIEEL